MTTADNFINRPNERVLDEPKPKESIEDRLIRLLSDIRKYDEAIKDAEDGRQRKLDEARNAHHELKELLDSVANQIFDTDKPLIERRLGEER